MDLTIMVHTIPIFILDDTIVPQLIVIPNTFSTRLFLALYFQRLFIIHLPMWYCVLNIYLFSNNNVTPIVATTCFRLFQNLETVCICLYSSTHTYKLMMTRAEGLRKRFVMKCFDFPDIFSVWGGGLPSKQPVCYKTTYPHV